MKLKLYHYTSNCKNSKSLILDPKYFGLNCFSRKEKQASNIKRIFFYTNVNHKEKYFNESDNLYIVSVFENYIYNVNLDKNGYIKDLRSKNNEALNINNLLNRIIQENYKGIFYESGGLSIVNWFEPIEVYKTSEREILNVA